MLMLGYFDTDDYDSRVYAYERGMRYSQSFPSYYGNGMRCAVLAETKFSKKFSLTAKIGTTKYFDRDKVGSSYQEIDSSVVTDLEIQLKVKI